MNEKEALLHSLLSTRVFTPGYEFVPKLAGRIPELEVHAILTGLQKQGLAELAYGRGWRAISVDPSKDQDEEVYRSWQDQVSLGLTVLGYQDWVVNTALGHGWNGE